MTRFGPAGNSNSFSAQGYKSSKQVPQYLEQFGLTAFEYQCGQGVRIKEATARELGEICTSAGIYMSLHAPYYISMSSVEESKRIGSLGYILSSAKAVDWLGGDRIIIHSGSCAKISREQAMVYATDTFKLAVKALDDEGLSHIHMCPEVMGKINQLGTLEEVVELCKIDERMIPCVDFGHLNARTFGTLSEYENYEHVFTYIKDNLGAERLRQLHVHFSKIEYTMNGGEKRHLTFEDTQYGPDFEPLCELLHKYNVDNAVIICESDGTQAEDATTMQNYYRSLLEK